MIGQPFMLLYREFQGNFNLFWLACHMLREAHVHATSMQSIAMGSGSVPPIKTSCSEVEFESIFEAFKVSHTPIQVAMQFFLLYSGAALHGFTMVADPLIECCTMVQLHNHYHNVEWPLTGIQQASFVEKMACFSKAEFWKLKCWSRLMRSRRSVVFFQCFCRATY